MRYPDIFLAKEIFPVENSRLLCIRSLVGQRYRIESPRSDLFPVENLLFQWSLP
jgi:hypothetical protein